MLFEIPGQTPDGRMRIYFVTEPGGGPGASVLAPPPASQAGPLPDRERRQDPLHPDAVFLTTGRQARPVSASLDACPLCPSPTGLDDGFHEVPWSGYRVAVFGNRFPALGPGPLARPEFDPPGGTLRAPAGGLAEMVLYTGDHDGDLGRLAPGQAGDVVRVWARRTAALYERPDTRYVYVFENRGREVGATLAHPHGQIYALSSVPDRMQTLARIERGEANEAEGQADGPDRGGCRLCRYLAAETSAVVRVVDREDATATATEGAGFVALCPFAPRFPYEVQVLPTRCVGRLDRLTDPEMEALGRVIARTVRRLDAVFGAPMPYMMFVVQGGRDPGPGPDPDVPTPRHLRVVFAPLRRSADRLKVLASSEVGADVYLTDVLPEDAAATLRAVGGDDR